jgi:hypothetical protein
MSAGSHTNLQDSRFALPHVFYAAARRVKPRDGLNENRRIAGLHVPALPGHPKGEAQEVPSESPPDDRPSGAPRDFSPPGLQYP